MDSIKKIKRTARLVAILSKYGFETLVTQTGLKKIIPDSYIEKNEKRKEVFSLSIYERIKIVLEELGPTYVKLGQLLSSRDDILPEDLTLELQKLQDDVHVEDIDLLAILKEELNIDPEEYFEITDLQPIAAASLSQVYIAKLKENKQKVIIKVKRKGIREVIEADLLIMKDFAQLLENYYEAARAINMTNIISTFEQSIISELSFLQELNNIERFRANFSKDETIYVPATYKKFSSTNILCMEYIDGIKISDRKSFAEHGFITNEIASKVVNSYLKQVIDYGFFHADPHSGNIFVKKDGRIAYIDYGSVGKMLPEDKDFLGDFIIYALNKDTKRLLHAIKKIAIKYNIPNENQLERELYDFLDIIHSGSVKELDVGNLMKRFSKLLNENRIVLPAYIYLLIRGIVLLEGIGRELGLETNIIDNIEPYVKKLMKERINPKYIYRKIFYKLLGLSDQLYDLPDDIHMLLQKVNNDELKFTHVIKGSNDIKNSINRLSISLMIIAMMIASSILILAKMPPVVWDISILGLLGFLSSGFLAAIVIFSILKDRNRID